MANAKSAVVLLFLAVGAGALRILKAEPEPAERPRSELLRHGDTSKACGNFGQDWRRGPEHNHGDNGFGDLYKDDEDKNQVVGTSCECNDLCNGDVNCQYWVWVSDDQICYRKKGLGRVEGSDKAWSGSSLYGLQELDVAESGREYSSAWSPSGDCNTKPPNECPYGYCNAQPVNFSYVETDCKTDEDKFKWTVAKQHTQSMLGNPDGTFWAAADQSTTSAWMEIDLGTDKPIAGFLAKGDGRPNAQFVKTVKIKLKPSNGDWEELSDDYAANRRNQYDADGSIWQPKMARRLRIEPQDWQNWVSMRLAVLVGECQTIDLKKCIFPFGYNNNEYSKCTTIHGELSCATEIHDNKNRTAISLGKCSDSCSWGEVGAVGDPHVTRADGTHFELRKTGQHVLLRIPPHGDSPKLHLSCQVERRGPYCANTFITGVKITGSWTHGLPDLIFTADGPFRGNSTRGVTIETDYVALKINGVGIALYREVARRQFPYLNVKVSAPGIELGGLLGHDSYAEAMAEQDVNCRPGRPLATQFGASLLQLVPA